ncbi:DUF4241 domain-containing protein [Bacillus safensis]|nr:DUF4241 domain-containing protein [Bacillus safensis]
MKENEFFGYGVNTGMGCFMDAEAALYLQAYEDKRYKEDNDFYLYEEFVFMTRWPFPCLQEDSVTGCTQAFWD